MPIPVLTPLLGFRQAQIMQLLWEHGAATARELHTWLTRDTWVAYMTVHNACMRLVECGMLKRRRVAADEVPARARQAHVYIPCLTQAELLQRAQIEPAPPASPQLNERESIEHLLAYLSTLQDEDGQRACALITSLLERAEAAERAALVYQAEAARALHRAAVAEEGAGQSAQPATPRPRARPIPSAAIYEYPGHERICRVCGRPAPPPPPHRQDGLRVCALEICRREARRRDNVAKQRRSSERKRAQQGVGAGGVVVSHPAIGEQAD
jgi:hypothetical protein